MPGRRYEMVFLKRKTYKSEREFRLACWTVAPGDGPHRDGFFAHGSYVPVELEHLVELVVLGPKTEQWVGEVVISLVERYGYSFAIERSRILEEAMPDSTNLPT